MSGLTIRQRDCLDAITRLSAGRGVAPSYDEIGAAIGVPNRSGIHRLVHGLAERGYITIRPDRHRSIAIAHQGRAVPFDDMAAAIAEEFFGGDEIKFAQVRRALIKAWGGARQ